MCCMGRNNHLSFPFLPGFRDERFGAAEVVVRTDKTGTTELFKKALASRHQPVVWQPPFATSASNSFPWIQSPCPGLVPSSNANAALLFLLEEGLRGYAVGLEAGVCRWHSSRRPLISSGQATSRHGGTIRVLHNGRTANLKIEHWKGNIN